MTCWENEKLELANQTTYDFTSEQLKVYSMHISTPGGAGVCGKVKVGKGEWRMPRLLQAMKDVISCDKRGVGAYIR